MQFHSVLNLSIPASGPVNAEQFLSTSGGVPTQGANVFGISRAPATAAGQLVPCDVLGTAIVTSGGVFAVGAALSTDASGNAIAAPGTAPNAVVARALQASTAAGQRVEVILIPN